MTEARRHLFLDLEDTIIMPVTNGWFNVQLKNVAKIKAFIAEFQPHYLHVFSFAIWDYYQLEQFNSDVRGRIEAKLGMKFSAVPTVDFEIIPAACKIMKISPELVDFDDLTEFWGKQEAFRLNMRHTFASNTTTNIEVVLLDDVVYNETFEFHDMKLKGRIINIDQMEEPHGIPRTQDSTALNP